MANRAGDRAQLAETYRKQGFSSVDSKNRALREMPIKPEEQAELDAWDAADRADAPQFSMYQKVR